MLAYICNPYLVKAVYGLHNPTDHILLFWHETKEPIKFKESMLMVFLEIPVRFLDECSSCFCMICVRVETSSCVSEDIHHVRQ